MSSISRPPRPKTDGACARKAPFCSSAHATARLAGAVPQSACATRSGSHGGLHSARASARRTRVAASSGLTGMGSRSTAGATGCEHDAAVGCGAIASVKRWGEGRGAGRSVRGGQNRRVITLLQRDQGAEEQRRLIGSHPRRCPGPHGHDRHRHRSQTPGPSAPPPDRHASRHITRISNIPICPPQAHTCRGSPRRRSSRPSAPGGLR